jgi:hypothetical protein
MLSLNKKLQSFGEKRTDERAKVEENIKKTDNEIDTLVYDLYGISKDERKIIDDSTKKESLE